MKEETILNSFNNIHLSLETWKITLNEKYNSEVYDEHSEKSGELFFLLRTGTKLIRSDIFLRKNNFNKKYIVGCPDYFYWDKHSIIKNGKPKETKIWVEFKTGKSGLSKNQLMWIEERRKAVKKTFIRIIWLDIEKEDNIPGENYTHFLNRMKDNYNQANFPDNEIQEGVRGGINNETNHERK